jgi:hypothetical protein
MILAATKVLYAFESVVAGNVLRTQHHEIRMGRAKEYHYNCDASSFITQTSKKEPLLLSAMSFTACCAKPDARSGLAPLNCILKHSWILCCFVEVTSALQCLSAVERFEQAGRALWF